jgi:RimJ/RimL family protein N-acetyltransferase
MKVVITPIAEGDVDSFRACLDTVARERRWLALFEAPPLDDVRTFVRGNIERGHPQVVAKDGERVVGWCDIVPGWHHSLRHVGLLGMGMLPPYRGQGLGRELLAACLALAARAGITRVELEARADNTNALRLYEHAGFEREGTKRRGMKVDGHYVDTIAMSLLIE